MECRICLVDARTEAPLGNAVASANDLLGTAWVMARWANTGADGRAAARLLVARRRISVGSPFGAGPPS